MEVPFALICDFYEHIEEHAPPLQPDGVMQKRERYYTPPKDPFFLLQSALQSNSNVIRANLELAQLLLDVQHRWTDGGTLAAVDISSLERLATASSLDAKVLLEAGRGLDFLMGDAAATALFRAGVSRAQRQYKDALPGDPAALDLLHLLDQTKALHRRKDYPALAERFDLAMRLYPALSVESRRAACLYAEALSKAGQSQTAADVITRVWWEDHQVGDLDLNVRGGETEMEWRAAWYLADAERWDESIKFCSDFVSRTSDEARRRRILGLWRSCLDREGKHEEALALQSKYHFAPRPRLVPSTTQTAGG